MPGEIRAIILPSSGAFFGPVALRIVEVDVARQAVLVVQVTAGVVAFHVDHAVKAAIAEMICQCIHIAITVTAGRYQPAHSVEEPVIPLRLKIDRRIKGVIFGNAEHIRMNLRQPVVDLRQHRGAFGILATAVIANVIDRVPAETVNFVLLDQHADLVVDEVFYFRAAEIGAGVAPIRLGFPLFVVKIDAAQTVLRPSVVLPHFQVGRTVVVVYHVHDDGNSIFVAGLDEALEAIGTAEG